MKSIKVDTDDRFLKAPEMFEHHNEPLLPRRDFLKRLAKYALISLSIVGMSLLVGMAGYHFIEDYSWIDSFLNAAMLMGGMGPVGTLNTDAGKLFAGFYAIYCGLVELVAVGIIAAPVFHRILHHFHLESGHKEQ